MPEWFASAMENLLDFSNILNASIAASWMVLAVIILRYLLKKAPRWMHVALWGLVAVRMLLPFSIESAFSLIPSKETVPREILVYEGTRLEESAFLEVVSNPVFSGSVTVELGETVDRVQISLVKMNLIWIMGIAVLLLYTAVSYWRLRRRVSEATILRGNIYQSENVASPFVLGLIRPRIYLPYGMNEQDLGHVVAHEQAHIRRKDHWWKPLGFFLLSIHWFNPLMWLAYVLLCRDIELACDEKVIKKLGDEQRADYTQALVVCSVNRRTIAACPLAFGEVGVKERVKSVMNYKKPAFWIVVLSVVACVVIAICFLTNPVKENKLVMGAEYDIVDELYSHSPSYEETFVPPDKYCVTADYHLYEKHSDESWYHLGKLEHYTLTNDELNSYNQEGLHRRYSIRKITDSYILRVEGNYFYLVFQTNDGKTYLAYGWEDIGERGQAGSDDTGIRRFYELRNTFQSHSVNVNFFQRSLTNVVENYVYCFHSYESDKIPGYHIVGFQSGNSNNHVEMMDLGFAVFYTNGEGYRLVDCKVYENAALVENGIFFCSDPAVADVNGEMRNDNTFDVLLILNDEVDKIERVYHADGREDQVYADTFINAPYMSVWSWEYSKANSSVSQYVYDKNGNRLSYDSVIPMNSTSWENLSTGAVSHVVKWFDYLMEPEEMSLDDDMEINISQFPDVTFRWSYAKMDAVVGNEILPLYSGMPIWNTYFCDLTGDGLPELCSTYSYGSGMIDSRVIIYDYANGVSYELSDRGFYDYSLRQNDSDGQLYVDKRSYPGRGLILSGQLVFKDGCIQILGQGSINTAIADIVDPTKDEDFFYDDAVEKFFEDENNEYFFSGIYSQYVIVHYADGTAEDIVTALNSGRATLADLDRFDIRYWAEPKPVDLSSAIISAILDHYKSTDPDGLYHCASFVLLEQVELCFDSNPPVPNQVIVYGMALHEKFSFEEETIREVESRYVPVKLTFERTENEGVTLLDAWFPDLRYNSWDEYSEAVYEQFVTHSDDLATSVLYAIQDNLYLVQLKQECYKQAVAYIGIDTTPILEDLFAVIESSPLYSSNPGSYIDAHPDEYNELIYYGEFSLRYIFSKFLEGDQIGLRGHIMCSLLDDIAPEAQLFRLYAMTGQEYFDEWKATAIRLSEQYDMEWIMKNQPAVWLLLQMLEDDDAVELPTGDSLTDVATPRLTMRTLRSLVDRYGEDLTWDTFDTYYSEEIISDLYALRYPIDADYYLLIIGNAEKSPVSIRLVSAHDPDSFIDIRTDSIDAFINATN